VAEISEAEPLGDLNWPFSSSSVYDVAMLNLGCKDA